MRSLFGAPESLDNHRAKTSRQPHWRPIARSRSYSSASVGDTRGRSPLLSKPPQSPASLRIAGRRLALSTTLQCAENGISGIGRSTAYARLITSRHIARPAERASSSKVVRSVCAILAGTQHGRRRGWRTPIRALQRNHSAESGAAGVFRAERRHPRIV